MWNILIAEDEPEIQQSLSDGLKAVARCHIVGNGELAVEAFQESIQNKKPYDVILLDVSMPIMDGFEALGRIRELEQQSAEAIDQEIIVFMITSYEESLLDKINIGWDNFITKPIQPEKLINQLKQYAPPE